MVAEQGLPEQDKVNKEEQVQYNKNILTDVAMDHEKTNNTGQKQSNQKIICTDNENTQIIALERKIKQLEDDMECKNNQILRLKLRSKELLEEKMNLEEQATNYNEQIKCKESDIAGLSQKCRVFEEKCRKSAEEARNHRDKAIEFDEDRSKLQAKHRNDLKKLQDEHQDQLKQPQKKIKQLQDDLEQEKRNMKQLQNGFEQKSNEVEKKQKHVKELQNELEKLRCRAKDLLPVHTEKKKKNKKKNWFEENIARQRLKDVTR